MLAVYIEWWSANHPWSDLVTVATGWLVGLKAGDVGLWILNRRTD